MSIEEDGKIDIHKSLNLLVKNVGETNKIMSNLAVGSSNTDKAIVGLKIRIRILELVVYGGVGTVLLYVLNEGLKKL